MSRIDAGRVHAIVLAAFAACGIVQVFLAGYAVFADPDAFIRHREFGYLFGWLTLGALVVALVGRLPRRIVGADVLLLVMFALQSLLVALRTDMPGLAAVHPVNGFAVIALAIVTARASWRLRAAPATGTSPAADRGVPAPAGAD